MHCISSNILSFLKHNTGQNIKHTCCLIIILQFSIFHEQLSYTWKNSNARRLFKETSITRCYRSVHLFIFIYIYMISIYSPIVDLKQQNRQSSLICRIMLAWFNLSAMYLIFSQIVQIFKSLSLRRVSHVSNSSENWVQKSNENTVKNAIHLKVTKKCIIWAEDHITNVD